MKIFALIFSGFLLCGIAAAEDVAIGQFANGSADGWTLSLGKEFPPGAQGSFAIIEPDSPGSAYAAYLEGSFANGGVYVSISKTLPTALPFKALKFKVKSSDYEAITIRLTDGSGQVHQQVISLNKDSSEWQDITIKDCKGTKRNTCWGGAKDGKWHDPLKAVSFLLENSALNDDLKNGRALFSDIILEK